MNLSYAVTTTKRKVDYFRDSLESIEDAGFNKPLIVCDGEYEHKSVHPFSASTVVTGVVPTFRRALSLLEDDWQVVFQDDIRVSLGLRKWLSNMVLSDDAIYSLYSADDVEPGWNEIDLTPNSKDPWPWISKSIGACGMVFPKRVARMFISEPPPKRTDRLGSAIAEFCFRNDIKLMSHGPSLIQHVGDVSTLHGITTDRKAASFAESIE